MDSIIEVKNFEKSFGNKKVHKSVTFDVRPGECLGLIGGSGTGKSVLLRSLIGLEKPDSGQILFKGNDISKLKEAELTPVRKQIAYAFQGGALFDSMTVFDNLAYPLREHTDLSEEEISDRIIKKLESFGLGGNDKLYPASLSGGMQKRVGLARAIILGPEVILYDEPTAGLDPYNTRKIQELILKLKSQGTTSILVTHDMPVAFAVCDRIAMLMEGRVKAIGTVEEIEKQGENLIAKFASGEAF
jgi:phospholipid/cholesterol/gamma-HCH transport system ATP-binding protein